MSFHSEVQQQQDVDVMPNLAAAIAELKCTIISAARRGEKRIVLNGMLAGASYSERAAVFDAAKSIADEGEFELEQHYVGEAGRHRNASGDLYIHVIKWE